jgi:hypothetical protein
MGLFLCRPILVRLCHENLVISSQHASYGGMAFSRFLRGDLHEERCSNYSLLVEGQRQCILENWSWSSLVISYSMDQFMAMENVLLSLISTTNDGLDVTRGFFIRSKGHVQMYTITALHDCRLNTTLQSDAGEG